MDAAKGLRKCGAGLAGVVLLVGAAAGELPKVYWGDSLADNVQRADPDGSNVETKNLIVIVKT